MGHKDPFQRVYEPITEFVWKLTLLYSMILVIRSAYNFAHPKTVELSWIIQKYVLIQSLLANRNIILHTFEHINPLWNAS